jgi:membrane peptidoglycan carboxypeptidase
MQMVKNVLLSHEKTLSRKLQELFLTWVVERRLGKDRIMELYLNAVEFGPGIYGIGHAAEHYFGKQAQDLSSFESAFLATLLPRPVERHEFWCRGAVPLKHLDYVHRIHLRMLARHAVTREEFDAAEEHGIVFSRAQWRGEEACLAEGRAVDDGTHAQEAISGLLTERREFGR